MKAQVAEDSAAAVADWETYVDELVSLHTDLADAINWRALASQSKPMEPGPVTRRQQKAETAIAKFKSGIFDIFRGGTARRRSRLEAEFADARVRDNSEFEKANNAYRAELAEWEGDTELARRLIDGDAAAIKEVIEEALASPGKSLAGSSVSFSIGKGFIHAKPKVHTDEIVPSFRRKQLASGKLSESKMPAGQFNKLYQDYVASVALKTAGDLFHILPLDEVYVTCLAQMLNPKTGHKEQTPILSVQFVKPTFSTLNLAHIDPSDSMANFNHAMSFSRVKGFAPIEPLKPIS
jgi:hypothetical protein